MTRIDWRIRALEINTCNCDWGCPCQFDARPTRGECRAAVAMRIESGHFGKLRLDGLIWAQLIAWPGPIHEGRGEVQLVVDARASRAQTDALFRILKGEETAPGATIFSVLAATIDKVHKPIFAPIEFEHDLAARRGRFSVPGLIEAIVEPIRNPVTGAEQGQGPAARRLRISRGRVREQPHRGLGRRGPAQLAGPPRLSRRGRDDRCGRGPLISAADRRKLGPGGAAARSSRPRR
jgi:hypothetical protein